MDRNSFTFYRSFDEAIAEMQDSDQLTVYRAISRYALEMKEPEFSDPIAKISWRLIKPVLDAQWKKYAAGKLGGCPKGITNNPAGRPTTKHKQSTIKALSKQDRDRCRDRCRDKEGKGENAAPAPASQEEKEFAEKMRETYPTLCTLERPLTCEEMKTLMNAHGTARVKGVLQDMENYTGITKKRSVYLTAIKWIRTDEK